MISHAKADIMIVDDQPENLMFLESLLKQLGHTVRIFSEGQQAFAAAANLAPDEVLGRSVQNAAEFARARNVTINAAPVAGGMVIGATSLLEKAFQALLETAVKLSAAGETVRMTCDQFAGSIRVTIKTPGRSIPQHVIPKFFDLFSVAAAITLQGTLDWIPQWPSVSFHCLA